MENIIDYIRYTNETFEEKKWNEVDSLVLCQLSYLKFDGLVPGQIWRVSAGATRKDLPYGKLIKARIGNGCFGMSAMRRITGSSGWHCFTAGGFRI